MIGAFLDSFPPILFIAVHIALLLFGVWVATKATKGNVPYAKAFWLYVVVHLGFLAFFAGIFTLKMSVLLEQVLVFAMVLWISMKSQRNS